MLDSAPCSVVRGPWLVLREWGSGPDSGPKPPAKVATLCKTRFGDWAPGLGVFVRWSGRAIAKGKKKCFNVFRLIFCTFLEVAKKHPTATLYSRQLGQELDADFAVWLLPLLPSASCVLPPGSPAPAPPVKGLKNLFWFFSFRHFFYVVAILELRRERDRKCDGPGEREKADAALCHFFLPFQKCLLPFFSRSFSLRAANGTWQRGGEGVRNWEWEWAGRRLPGQM